MMNKFVQYLGLGCIVLATCSLAACGKPQPSGSVITQQVPQNAQKFSQGPHQGELGQRQYYFACDSLLLPQHYSKSVKKQAQYLQKHPQQHVQLDSHDDASGDPATSLLMSYQRAVTVKNKLKRYGAQASQITMNATGAFNSKPYQGSTNSDDCRVDLIYTS